MHVCNAHQKDHVPRSQGPCRNAKAASHREASCRLFVADTHEVPACKELRCQCITCPACQGTPGPSDPVVHSQTKLTLQQACKLCCCVRRMATGSDGIAGRLQVSFTRLQHHIEVTGKLAEAPCQLVQTRRPQPQVHTASCSPGSAISTRSSHVH
jgi:hypothetical protein